jgi:predicted deacetylase
LAQEKEYQKIMVRYLIRLDDANQFFDEKKWLRLELMFDELQIKPIVAVIPKNEDVTLKSKSCNAGFWDIVRRWQSKGWSIALHGYEHQLHTIDKNKSIFPFHNRSEFVGLSLTTQKRKIKQAINIFHDNEVFPTVWVAPAHSFDLTTLEALQSETEIRIVSDGIAIFPYHMKEFLFIPQQLWVVRRRLFGIWTICLHPETMQEQEFEDLYLRLSHPKIRFNFVKVEDIHGKRANRGIADHIYSFCFWKQVNLKKTIKAKILFKSC